MNFTEGFGKKWIDRILGKVDKDQGVANAGKVLGIGADGQVVPVEQSGGGSGSFPYVEPIENITGKDLFPKVKIGDILVINLPLRNANGNISSPTLETKGDFKVINGSITFGTGVSTDKLVAVTIASMYNGNYYFAETPIQFYQYNSNTTVDNVQLKITTLSFTKPNQFNANGVMSVTSTAYCTYYSDDVTILPRSNSYTFNAIKDEGFNGYIIHNS